MTSTKIVRLPKSRRHYRLNTSIQTVFLIRNKRFYDNIYVRTAKFYFWP